MHSAPPPRSVLTRAVAAVLVAGLVSGSAASAFAADPPVQRIAGDDRVGTAVALDAALPGMTEMAIVVSSQGFADGLAATALADAVHGSVFVTPGDKLDPRVADRIEMSGYTGVLIVGGPGVVKEAVGQALADRGFDVLQVGGRDRFETSLVVAELVMAERNRQSVPVMLASGLDFADALASGAAAGKQEGVVLLTNGKSLTSDVRDFLTDGSASQVTAVGGAAAAAMKAAGVRGTSVVGTDRFETSARLAALTHPTPTHAVLASGEMFPDGLGGGAYAARRDAPLLLTRRASLPTQVSGYLSATRPPVTVVGGTGAVSAEVVSALTALLAPTPAPTGTPSAPSSPTATPTVTSTETATATPTVPTTSAPAATVTSSDAPTETATPVPTAASSAVTP